jgi:ABC-type Fe3+/spermidine/putrescine transport system ATPase subunit
MSFSVRPQHLRLGDGGDNTITCHVEDIITHASEGTQVLLTPAAAQDMEFQLRSWDFIEELSAGDEVQVSWDADDTTMLERTSVVDNVDLEKDILGE